MASFKDGKQRWNLIRFKSKYDRNACLDQIAHSELMATVVFRPFSEGKLTRPTTTKTRTFVRGTRTEQPACWVSAQLLRKGRWIISVSALVACALQCVRTYVGVTGTQKCSLCLRRFHRNCISRTERRRGSTPVATGIHQPLNVWLWRGYGRHALWVCYAWSGGSQTITGL